MMNYWFYIFEPRNEEIDPKKISHFKTQLIRLMQLRKESRSGAFSCNIKERFPTFRLFDTLPLSPDRRLEFLLLLFFNKVSNSERFSQGLFLGFGFQNTPANAQESKTEDSFPFWRTLFWTETIQIVWIFVIAEQTSGKTIGGGGLLPIMTGRLSSWKWYLFHALGIWKGWDFTSWSIWKVREICQFGRSEGPKGMTNALAVKKLIMAALLPLKFSPNSHK